MRGKITIALTLLVVAVGVWLFYQTAAIASRGGEDAPLYSTERHDPYGSAALKDLLTERGVPTSILERPIPDDAPGNTGAVLIQVLPAPETTALGAPPPPVAAPLPNHKLQAWMEKGNTVIQLTRATTDLMTQNGLGISAPVAGLKDIQAAEAEGKAQGETGEVDEDVWWIDYRTAGSATPRRLGELEMYSPAILAPVAEGDKEWKPLAVQPHSDHWVAAVRGVGKGRLIVVGAPSLALNQTLGKAGNLEFILRLIAPPSLTAAPSSLDLLRHTPVIFDEWSHGLGHGSTVIEFIRRCGLLPAFFQLIVAVIFYVWSSAVLPPRMQADILRRRSSAEQIETLGHLYGQALKSNLVFEKVFHEVRRRLAAVLRCTPAGIEGALARVPAETAAKARGILARLDDIGRGQGPTCPDCGYDLTHNESGVCPECGVAIPAKVKQRIAETRALAAVPERRPGARKNHAPLAAVLRDSHLFVEELNRVRSRRV